VHGDAKAIDGRDLAIGVLSVTGCILLVAFILLTTLSPPASAIGMNDRAGDYILLTQQLTSSTEAVVVVDAASQRILLYGFDLGRKQLLPLTGFELNSLHRPEDREGGSAPPGRP